MTRETCWAKPHTQSFGYSHNAGLSVGRPEEFIQAAANISTDYNDFAKGIRGLKEFYSETDPKDTISRLLTEVCGQLST